MEISEIIERVDILEYISQYCDLEKRSDGEYWGLSPLKDEKTPSFSVNVDLQRFYDFSSGQGGNVLDFICQYNCCDFYRGLKILKEYAKIDESSDGKPHRRLLAASIARKYKKNPRKQNEPKSILLPPDYMDQYEWDEEKLLVWSQEGIGIDAMKKFQVRYDPFSNRIVYPIRNIGGDIINVCGRTLVPDFKEKGIRKYTYFKPLGVLDTIYGFFENSGSILDKNEIILFEGAKSVMMADTWGVHNTGAVLTSHLNQYQFKILIQLGVHVVFAFDAEVDIRKDPNINRLLPYARIEWVKNKNRVLDDKDSPVDKGKEVWEQLYRERQIYRK